MKCWEKDCKVNHDNFNPFLPHNERVRDFIRWNELIATIVVYTLSCLTFGWWGILVAVIFNYVAHVDVGMQLGTYPDPEYPPNTCSAGIKDCIICDNEYGHEFNVEHQVNLNKLTWKQKMNEIIFGEIR